MSDFRTFVVPYDFSPHSRAALELAQRLGRITGAEIHVVHVVQTPTTAFGYGAYADAAMPPPIDMSRLREGALQSLRDVVADAEGAPGKLEAHVAEGVGIADVLCETADQLGADLIVMGTHGRTGLARVFLGSVAERTMRDAPCPVLTVGGRGVDTAQGEDPETAG